MKERDFIERLERAFPHLRREDDAAVRTVRFSGSPGRLDGIMVLSTDAAVEGIHFDRRYTTLSQAVQKLVTSNVSDIYAMGGDPEGILFAAGLREGCTGGEAEEIVEGLRKAAGFYHIDLAGGDTVRSGDRFFFNISIVGAQRHGMPVEREGARAGDRLVLFGECGGSLLGMELLRHVSGLEEMSGLPGSVHDGLPSPDELKGLLPGLAVDTDGPELERMTGVRGEISRQLLALAKRHLVPAARPVESGILGADPPMLTAMIDVSDGLARDLRNLCRASGVGAVLYEDRLPIPDYVSLFLGDERDRWTDHALSSGEEYVMLASCRVEPPTGRVIGEIVPAGEGLTLVGRDGRRRELPNAGYEHTF
jgi:thiamine-monophosphate kinase